MANDGDEQQREEQQQQELDEIHRSFTAMGARMGSLFEPAQLDEPKDKPGFPERPAALPAPAPRSDASNASPLVVGGRAGPAVRRRHRLRLGSCPRAMMTPTRHRRPSRPRPPGSRPAPRRPR
jgi:hypothetical protein